MECGVTFFEKLEIYHIWPQNSKSVFFRTTMAPRAILFWHHFGHLHFFISTILNKKRHNKRIITKAEKYPMECHSVTLHIGGWVGSFEFVTKCDRVWVGA